MDLQQGKKIAFILSSPRSGSTLLRLTLGKFPGIISLPETHFYTFLNQNRGNHFGNETTRKALVQKWMNYHTIRRMELPAEKLSQRFIKDGRSWQDLFEFTVEEYLAFRNIPLPENYLIVEKTPAHIFYKADILQHYPDATLIYLVRDPRDVVASLKHCNWSTSNVFTNAKVWKNAARSFEKGPRRYTIHYETLVTDPEKSLADLADFLKMDFEKETIFQDLEGVPPPKMASTKQSFQPITKKNIGYYKDLLSGIDRDRDVIEAVCGAEMEKLGYKVEGVVKDKRYRRAMLMWKFSHLLTKLYRI
jgi:hypothetical protein